MKQLPFLLGLLFCSLLPLIISENSTPQQLANQTENSIAAPVFLPLIENDEIWKMLAYKPTAETLFSNVEVVKVVVDLKSKITVQVSEVAATGISHSNLPEVSPASTVSGHNATFIYFVNSKKHELHITFIQDEIETHRALDLKTFNSENYFENANRRYILGMITLYRDQQKYTFELNSIDDLPYPSISALFFKLKTMVHFSNEFYFRPTSPLQTKVLQEGNAKCAVANECPNGPVPILNNEDLYGNMKYQGYNHGTSYGRVKIVRYTGDSDAKAEEAYMTEALSNVEPKDIVVIISDIIPNDLPVCSGIITSTLQAPLCHISILAQNRGTPNMFLRNAYEEFKNLENQTVKLSVTEQGHTVEPCSEEEVAKHHTTKVYPKIEIEKADRVTKEAKTKTKVFTKAAWEVPTCGTKAAHLAGMAKERRGLTHPQVTYLTEGFVVPFAYYFEHMESIFSKLLEAKAVATTDDPKLDQYVKDFILPVLSNRQELTQRLKDVRDTIKESSVSPQVIKLIREQLKKLKGRLSSNPLFAGTSKIPIIMRSSSNAEDLAGFNGAGLYDSPSLPNGTDASPKEIEDTVKRVWSSVWTIKSMSERALYQIDEVNVGMAILVQPLISCDDRTKPGAYYVAAKGVAITTSPIKEYLSPFFVNVQTALGSVTDSTPSSHTSPEKQAPAEQLLLYRTEKRLVVETISQIQTDKEHIMTLEELGLLRAELKQIHHSEFFFQFGEAYAADVEFIVVRSNDPEPASLIILLQARPYPIIVSQNTLEARLNTYELTNSKYQPKKQPDSKENEKKDQQPDVRST